MRMVTVMCQFQLLVVSATLAGGNCRFQWVVTVVSDQQGNAVIKCIFQNNFSNSLHDREVDDAAS